MPRKLLRRLLPSRETLDNNRFLRRCAPFLTHHNLWHLNRHSVAGGLAVGLASSMIPGPLQMLGATILAVLFRVNLPVAIFGTLFSNPFTIVPLYLLAFGIGRLITGASGHPAPIADAPVTDWANLMGTAHAWMDWMLALGAPLAIGIVALALLLALAGYGLVQLGWRLHVLHALRSRRSRRQT
ncbi:DUF2062 domain-containing protein [Chitinimonas sp. BJB300]|uniref:DUF2062 domain-containing protein n=1 Tax=Chitinimonas sp. BJB300 TaxID=1559339 RepID=UPI000C0F8AEC|nr:DUF2062 domain-containing protein [Chitinimonas sp. BJB300]PHV10927.1 hypothetical protein CSQ89_13670 [Chitinimonas sp. BJB300]TSJ89941.1 DUF2062 domain-containing protein [Chitinimonas sp. BJB300]